MILYLRQRLCLSTLCLRIWAMALPGSACCLHGAAQQLSFQSFTASQGLSQNSIYCITETADGFMWFGTQDGLNRFDGKNFMQINAFIKNGNPALNQPVPTSKMITALHAGPEGFLWVGTTSEILLYDPILNQYQPPAARLGNFKMPEDTYITGIVEDKYENIWIATQSDGLFCYNKRRQQMAALLWQGASAPGKIISICLASSQNIIVAGEKDIYTCIGGTFIPFHLDNKLLMLEKAAITECKIIRDKFWLILNTSKIILVDTAANGPVNYTLFNKAYNGRHALQEPRIIHQSDSNTVWIGSRSDGLLKVDITSGSFEHTGTTGMRNHLKSQFILSLYTSSNRITWAGLSGGGVAKYDPSKIKFSLWRNEGEAGRITKDNMLLSIFSDNNEDFYAGTLYGGLMHRNIKTGYCRYFRPPLSSLTAAGANNIYQVIAGENNLLWLATWAGLYSFNRDTKAFTQYTSPADVQTRQLYSVIRLKTINKLLAGGESGGLRFFNLATRHWEPCPDTAHFLSHHLLRVRYMQEIGNGDVLMSTEKLNLVKYNYYSGVFTVYPQLQKIASTSRHFTRDEPYIWIATDEGLVQALAETMQVIKLWNTRNALPNEYIYAVATDRHERVWFSSNAGLAALNPATGVCEKFTEDDGLQAMEFNTAACYKDTKGRIWFGGINGMNMVDPEKTMIQKAPPPPLITNITVMNAPYIADTAIPYTHCITLPYNQNFVGFEFQSPNNMQSENVGYEYMLTGVDTGWVNNGGRNYASYTQLSPGNYELKIRTLNNAGVANSATTTLALAITPPWFRRWWFYTLCAAASTAFIYAFMHYRIKQVKKMEWLRQHISANLHDDIGASLSSIHVLSELSRWETDVVTRNKYLRQINEQTTDVIASLRDIVWSINPQNDKLDIIIARMKRYAAELLEAKNIDFEFETNTRSTDEIADVNTRQNLYLIFKEAVNNLAKYSGAGKATIRLHKEYNEVTLEVEDNGRGFNPLLVTKGNGISNMERRAKLGRGNFEVISAAGSGTRIKVSLRV